MQIAEQHFVVSDGCLREEEVELLKDELAETCIFPDVGQFEVLDFTLKLGVDEGSMLCHSEKGSASSS